MILASERFGASEERLGDVWRFEESGVFSRPEKAALAFAQAATAVPNAVDEAASARLRRHWPDEAIGKIMAVVSLFGYLNRWNDGVGSSLAALPRSRGQQRLGETGWRVGAHA